jgi:hypothetical protein
MFAMTPLQLAQAIAMSGAIAYRSCTTHTWVALRSLTKAALAATLVGIKLPDEIWPKGAIMDERKLRNADPNHPITLDKLLSQMPVRA